MNRKSVQNQIWPPFYGPDLIHKFQMFCLRGTWCIELKSNVDHNDDIGTGKTYCLQHLCSSRINKVYVAVVFINVKTLTFAAY
jgi:hypothetical protein